MMFGRSADQVGSLVEAWKAEGSPEQEPFDWSKGLKNWYQGFPEHRSFLENLANPIGRYELRQIFTSQDYSETEKFLAVMIWGYGDRGYGPYRVNNIMLNLNFESALSECIKLCKASKPVEAYNSLAHNRVRGLGPSFGTKLICFASPTDSIAPIYDSFVAKWVNEFAAESFQDVSTNPEIWNVKTYSKYVNWVGQNAKLYGCNADEIELLIFQDAINIFGRQSPWSS